MSHNQLSEATQASLSRLQSFSQSRALVRLQEQTELQMARVAATAAVQVTRVEAAACVGRRAMFETALLTQCEQSLATLVPLAASRLQAVADVATLGLAEILADTIRELAR